MSGGGAGRSEFALIADLFAPLSKGADGALELLDDAALIDIPSGHQIVAAADTLVGGVHFRLDDSPDMIARKALRVNLSDLAAMGAAPVGFLQTLVLNNATNDSYLENYAAGLRSDVEHFNVPLLGGDTTAGPGPFIITITALGMVKKGEALLRSGARTGDILCVTGSVGDSALGLAGLTGDLKLPADLMDYLSARYHLPQPRLAMGHALSGLASACIDVSDGLVADVAHICAASGVSAVIEQGAIPLSAGAKAAAGQDPKWWQSILGGGDDYELAFTVNREHLEQVVAIAEKTDVSVAAIGRIAEATGDRVGVVVIDSTGAEIPISAPGYRHR